MKHPLLILLLLAGLMVVEVAIGYHAVAVGHAIMFAAIVLWLAARCLRNVPPDRPPVHEAEDFYPPSDHSGPFI